MPVAVVPQIVRDQYNRPEGFSDFPATVGTIPDFPAGNGYPVPVAWNLAINETELMKRQGIARGAANAIDEARVSSNLGPVVNPNSMARFGAPEQFWIRWGIAGPTAAKFFTRLNRGEPIFQTDDFPQVATPPATGSPTPSGPTTDPRCAQFGSDANDDIATLRAQYARAGVPDEHIITRVADQTLAGAIVLRQIQANRAARFIGCSTVPFPAVVPAESFASWFPPQDGYINFNAGHLPSWYIYGDPRMPTTSDGPWRPGDKSSYTSPKPAWHGGKPAPPPFSYPNSIRYYFGLKPGYSGMDPQTGNTVDIPPNVDDAPTPPPPATTPPIPTDTVPTGPPTVSGPITPNAPSGVPTATPSGLNPDGTPVRPPSPVGDVAVTTPQAGPLPTRAVFPVWMWAILAVAAAAFLNKKGGAS